MSLFHFLSFPDELDHMLTTPAQVYVRDTKAMASTAVDVKELPNAYVFVADLPGLKSSDIKVNIESDNVMIISGERKPEEVAEGTRYLKKERSSGKFLRKFTLPQNANLETIKAASQDGVLSVTVEKIPPPEPRKPKSIDVQVS